MVSEGKPLVHIAFKLQAVSSQRVIAAGKMFDKISLFDKHQFLGRSMKTLRTFHILSTWTQRQRLAMTRVDIFHFRQLLATNGGSGDCLSSFLHSITGNFTQQSWLKHYMTNLSSSGLVSYTLWNVCVRVSLLPHNTRLGISSALRKKQLDLNFAAKTSSTLAMQLATGNIKIGVQRSYPLKLNLVVLASLFATRSLQTDVLQDSSFNKLLDSLKAIKLALKQQQVDEFLTWALEYQKLGFTIRVSSQLKLTHLYIKTEILGN